MTYGVYCVLLLNVFFGGILYEPLDNLRVCRLIYYRPYDESLVPIGSYMLHIYRTYPFVYEQIHSSLWVKSHAFLSFLEMGQA